MSWLCHGLIRKPCIKRTKVSCPATKNSGFSGEILFYTVDVGGSSPSSPTVSCNHQRMNILYFAPVGTYSLTARDCSIACCNRISGTAPSHCRCFPVEKYQPICRYSEESAPLIFLCPLRNIPPSAVSHRIVCEQQDHR